MRKTNVINVNESELIYDERTGLLTREMTNGTILSFLFGGYGDYISKKAAPYLGFPRKTFIEFENQTFVGTMNVDGILENVYLAVGEYDESWGGYEVRLITIYDERTKLMKKHDIAMLKCMARDYEKMIRKGRREFLSTPA